MEPITITAERVAIQGYQASYHELAAKQFFGEHISLDMCASFPQLFQAMKHNRSTYAVMAIENSLAGTILPNYALLRDSGLTVIGEVYLRISHQLMALPGQKIEEIQAIHSHPMALAQCNQFILNNLHAQAIEKPDTAGSAAEIANQQLAGIAAVASREAAEHYGLEILVEDIEDNKRNFTRFLVLCMPEQALKYDFEPNKASICFNLKHEPGSLAQVMLSFANHGLNLTKIQSSPIPGREFQYFFHIDLEFDEYSKFQRALVSINSVVEQFKCLGEYRKGIR